MNTFTKIYCAIGLTFIMLLCSNCKDGVTVDCSDITTPTTWRHTEGNGWDYLVNCNLKIKSTLTIEPGTIVHFGHDCGLEVDEGGQIITSLQSPQPDYKYNIQLTPVWNGNQEANYWKGIHFTPAANLSSSINNVVMINAGLNNASSISPIEAAIVIDGGQHQFKYLTIDSTYSNGIAICKSGNSQESNEVCSFLHLKIMGCGQWPLVCTPNNLGHNIRPFFFERLFRNKTLLLPMPFAGSFPLIVFRNPIEAFPLEVNQSIHISAPIQFAAGLEMQFKKNTELEIMYNEGRNTLSTTAVAGNPVRLKLLEPVLYHGDRWLGIKYNENGPGAGIYLHDISIDRAGIGATNGAIKTTEGPVRIQLSRMTISDCDAFGIYLNRGNTFETNVADNTFNRCLYGKVRLPDGTTIR